MVDKIETGLIRKLNVDPDCEFRKLYNRLELSDLKDAWTVGERFVPIEYITGDGPISEMMGPLDPEVFIAPWTSDAIGGVTLQLSSVSDFSYWLGLILSFDGHIEECRRIHLDQLDVDRETVVEHFRWWLVELVPWDSLFKSVRTELFTLVDKFNWAQLATTLLREFVRFEKSALAAPGWQKREDEGEPFDALIEPCEILTSYRYADVYDD